MDVYLRELEDFDIWAKSHPNITSVLTHGLNNISMLRGKPDSVRYQLPEVMVRLLKNDNWSIELMLHLMASDSPYPPYNPELDKLVEKLIDLNLLEKEGVFIIHRHNKEEDIFPNNFKILKEKSYGISKIIFGTRF